VRRHVAELIDVFIMDGGADIVRQFAMPLPVGVAGRLLGVPAEKWDEFRLLSNTLVTPEYDMQPEDFDVLKRKIRAYVAELIESKRRTSSDDLVGWFVRACDDERLISGDDLIGLVFTLLVGSHETTTNFIGTAMYSLLRHSDQLDLLRKRPGLIDTAVPELLRYDGPFEAASLRFPTQDVELAGIRIPKGAAVVGIITSANRDTDLLPDADVLNITRAPVADLAFGHGDHFCPGRMLALLEAKAAIAALVRRLQNLRLAPDGQPSWRPGLFFRGPRELRVLFG
jgi:cytochrome P450